MILLVIILLIIGLVFSILGLLIWKKEKMSLLHSYHTDKVSAEDKSSFCRLSGLGILSIGAGIIIAGIFAGITESPNSLAFFAAGFAVGMILLITAGVKYNR